MKSADGTQLDGPDAWADVGTGNDEGFAADRCPCIARSVRLIAFFFLRAMLASLTRTCTEASSTEKIICFPHEMRGRRRPTSIDISATCTGWEIVTRLERSRLMVLVTMQMRGTLTHLTHTLQKAKYIVQKRACSPAQVQLEWTEAQCEDLKRSVPRRL